VPQDVGGSVDLVGIGMSFTLLRLVLSPIADILTPSGEIIVLVKPQFEVGKDPLANDGVVKKAAACEAVLRDIREFIEAETPWRVQQLKKPYYPPLE